MSTRIYKVTTPTGYRLVEASTKSQAINHCVGTDYNAEPILSSELYAAIQAGGQVEKVEPAKKSDTPAPSHLPPAQGSLPAQPTTVQPSVAVPSNPPVSTQLSTPTLPPQASTEPQANSGNQPQQAPQESPPSLATPQSAPPPAVATATTAPAAAAAEPALPAFLKTQPAAFNPPPPANGVKAVLEEQARINPGAAAAAGVPPVQQAPAPIIAPRAAPAAEEKQWEDREPQ